MRKTLLSLLLLTTAGGFAATGNVGYIENDTHSNLRITYHQCYYRNSLLSNGCGMPVTIEIPAKQSTLVTEIFAPDRVIIDAVENIATGEMTAFGMMKCGSAGQINPVFSLSALKGDPSILICTVGNY
jgi:hypothetical protein